MSYTPYYQLCGFQGHIPCGHQGEEQLANELGQALSHQGVLELVLGIVPTGASYVLLTEDQCFQARRHSKHGWLPHEFISLSPIIFRNAKELGSKLSTYKQKSGKKGGDSSQANKKYTLSGAVGTARAMFEHQRVLHCILNSNSQTPFNFSKFALPVASWARKLQFLSLTFNMWAADSRPRHEQLTGPKILDIGWSRFSISSPSPLSAAHVVVSENRKFRNRGISSPFRHGTTETIARDDLAIRLQSIFHAHQSRADTPTILLVYDEDATCAALKHLGVDVGRWESGIRNLLWPQPTPQSHSLPSRESRDPRASRNYNDRYDPRGGGHSQDSRRSQSPHRGSHSSSRRRSPSPPPSAPRYAPIYVVDVRSLFGVLRVMDPGGSLLANASELGLNVDKSGWNAGNESSILFDMWCSMSRGPSIDEQHAIRWPGGGNGSSSATQPGPSRDSSTAPSQDASSSPSRAMTSAPQQLDEEEEDFDPNDYVPSNPDANAVAEGPFLSMYDDDDDDYEEVF